MTTQCHLLPPPIEEALIDFRVALPEGADDKKLEALHSRIKDRYPTKKTLHEGRLGIRFDFATEEHRTTETQHTKLGFRYESENGRQIAQFRMNGFTYSELAPYTRCKQRRYLESS